jgi:hypothetical protein
MALQAKHGILPSHSASIIDNSQQSTAAALRMDFDMAGTGIQAVLYQFPDDCGWSLHDFPRGYLAGEGVWKNANFGHEIR